MLYQISHDHMRLMLAALEAVAPSGGGSDAYTVRQRLAEQAPSEVEIDSDSFHKLVGDLQTTAHEEWLDGHGFELVNNIISTESVMLVYRSPAND